jgi:hypothetical protein
MHPLDGSKERLIRSGECLADLNNIVIDFLRQLKAGSQEILGQSEVPMKFAILVGECVYNLRSALDYLIYELACFDSKTIVNGTQFPIEVSKKGFDRRKNDYLRGISDKHVAMIKQLQPFCECTWTKTLRDISNPDKHRHLTIITPRVVARPNPVHIMNPRVHVSPQMIISKQIAFSDGTLVLPILKQLQSQVTQTIDSFYPEFE